MAIIRVGESKSDKESNGRVFTASFRRDNIMNLPPFSFSGTPNDGDETGRWFPRVAVQLTGLVVTARTNVDATGPSSFFLKRKGPTNADPSKLSLAGEWSFHSVQLAKDSIYQVYTEFDAPTTNQPSMRWTFDASDWLSIVCVTGGGHEDVVFSFTGHATGAGYIEPGAALRDSD